MNTCHELTFVETTPAGNKCSASNEILVCFGHTNWYDVRLKDDRLIESQQCQVVFECAWIELWMRRNNLDATFLIQIRFLLFGQIVFTQTQQQIRRRYTEKTQFNVIREKEKNMRAALTCQHNGLPWLPNSRSTVQRRIYANTLMFAIDAAKSAMASVQTMPSSRQRYVAPETFVCHTLPSRLMWNLLTVLSF